MAEQKKIFSVLGMLIPVLLLGGFFSVGLFSDQMKSYLNPEPYPEEETREDQEQAPAESAGQDLRDLTWNRLADAPWSPRDTHAVMVFQDKLWLMGGLSGATATPGYVDYWLMPTFNDVWASEDGAHWERIAEEAAWSKRRSIPGIVWQDAMWIMGGYEGETSRTKNDVWRSEDGNQWTLVAESAQWAPREGHWTVVYDDKLWVFGGVDFGARRAMNDVWYTEDGARWIQATQEAPWSPRYAHRVIVFQDKMWLMAGLAPGQPVSEDIWVTENGKDWELVMANALWPGRHDPGLVVFGDHLWLIGGWSEEKALNDTWFSADGIHWEQTGTNGPWEGREDHGVVVFQDKIWITGGMDANWKWRNDIWYSVFPDEEQEAEYNPEG
ncbi:MAG: hypothetical protein Q8P39_02305 [Candidatus Yanofskybacteria bacterium]|nr:hypothetical protein [Candidatus Yanofskybacteria bacterium]